MGMEMCTLSYILQDWGKFGKEWESNGSVSSRTQMPLSSEAWFLPWVKSWVSSIHILYITIYYSASLKLSLTQKPRLICIAYLSWFFTQLSRSTLLLFQTRKLSPPFPVCRYIANKMKVSTRFCNLLIVLCCQLWNCNGSELSLLLMNMNDVEKCFCSQSCLTLKSRVQQDKRILHWRGIEVVRGNKWNLISMNYYDFLFFVDLGRDFLLHSSLRIQKCILPTNSKFTIKKTLGYSPQILIHEVECYGSRDFHTGVSTKNDYDVNSLACPRKAGEAIGGITRLKHQDGREMTINVEYNQLDPLLRATTHPDGDKNDESGYSPFPGARISQNPCFLTHLSWVAKNCNTYNSMLLIQIQRSVMVALFL